MSGGALIRPPELEHRAFLSEGHLPLQNGGAARSVTRRLAVTLSRWIM